MIVHSEEHNHHRRQDQHPQTVLRHKVLLAVAAHTQLYAPRYTVTNQPAVLAVESLAGQLACLQAAAVQAASKARLEAVGTLEVSVFAAVA